MEEVKNAKLLIVDDEKMFTLMVGGIMEDHGYLPDLAFDGDEAIAKIDAKDYDVIFTDIKMPGASGLEALRRAREKNPETQVVVISAFDDAENILFALRNGAFDFVRKPVEIPAILPGLADRALEKRRLLAENRELLEGLRARTAELEGALDTIRRQQEELVQSERLKVLGAMSSGLAHEINNPLAFISTNVQTIEKYMRLMSPAVRKAAAEDEGLKKIGDNMGDLFSGIRTGVLRVSQIANALRVFSRKDAEPRGRVSLRDCIHDAVNVLSPQLKDARVEIIAVGNGRTVKANRQNLVHAIVNLLQNAIDATEGAADPRIEVRVESGRGVEALEVRDNGRGIETDVKDKMFELFFTTKPVGKGTGLGLPIALSIISDTGGRITVESPGRMKGAVVRVEWRDKLGGDGAEPERDRGEVIGAGIG